MDWKDTVMSDNQLYDILGVIPRDDEDIYDVIKAQAEISFKAGQKDVCTVAVSDIIGRGVEIGRKEVVEWIERTTHTYHSVPWDEDSLVRNLLEEGWQAQKKRWNTDTRK